MIDEVVDSATLMERVYADGVNRRYDRTAEKFVPPRTRTTRSCARWAPSWESRARRCKCAIPTPPEVEIARSAFMRSDLSIAGFAVIDAVSLEEATALAAATPYAVAHGVVAVWPLEEPES